MLKTNYFLFCSIGLFILLFFVPHNYISAAVVINEIYPKTEDVSKTWIELYNNGEESVSLDRWKIENTFGTPQFFSLNASAIIPGKGFIILPQPQYGFTLNKEGDTLRIFDASNTKIDEQTYPGILGFYQSMGRSTDGAGVWTDCQKATNNAANDCLAPPPTSTPLPTETPGPTLTPYPTDAPMVLSTISENPIQLANAPTNSIPERPLVTPTAETVQQSSFPFPIIAIMGIVIVWIIIIGILMWKKKGKSIN